MKYPLSTPEELQKQIPLESSQAAFIHQARGVVEAILKGWDSRRLMIVGPCSIHDLDSTREYALRFKRLAARVSDRFFLIMRTYFEKPRTIGGWKGMLYDPDLDGSHDIAKGIYKVRTLLSELTQMGVPVGCELLEINTALYYSDFLTWGCVGARTCSSTPHRQLAASLDMPIGFKNSVEGNIDHAIHGLLSAGSPHVYLGLSQSGQIERVQAEGNSLCHIVLRGGSSGPNYSSQSVQAAIQKCRLAEVSQKILIDCSHDNCGKKPHQQMNVFKSVIDQIVGGNENIMGAMLESHLYEGTQEISPSLRYGVSITDPCLDWETTKQLILEAHERVCYSPTEMMGTQR